PISPFPFSPLTGIVMLGSGDCWTYHYSNFNMTWVEARNWCQTHFTDMVAIQNMEENTYLNENVPFNRRYYWIGIRKINSTWTWIGTNKKLSKEAQNWAPKEPNNKKNNEDCVEIYIKREKNTGKWNDERCGKEKAALCYKAACNSSSCSGHGECIETINSYTCQCDEGFYGSECEFVVGCETLESPEEGFMTCTHPHGNFTYNSACDFGCSEGFCLFGSERIRCAATEETTSGNWTAPAPSCQIVKCNPLKSPEQGAMNCSHFNGDFTYNSTCDFSCSEGFRLTGPERRQCTASGEWTGAAPMCEVVKCNPLKSPEQGAMNCSHPNGDFAYNSTCDFSCSEGFRLTGSERQLQCTASGEWTGNQPTCEAITCGTPSAPSHGSMNCTHPIGNLLFNSTCEFSCAEGFKLIGSDRMECTVSGEWTSETPECEAVKCETLTPSDDGAMNCSHPIGQFRYSSTCLFVCEGEAVLNGSSSLECTALGKWTAETPSCKVVGKDHTFLITSLSVASVLSLSSITFWLLKRLRRKTRKFSLISNSSQSSDTNEVYQNNTTNL
uniref:E-selectin n=1 Tax=Latimeria chalumnae TaxID=7897 RepID=H2ZZU4_LATCH